MPSLMSSPLSFKALIKLGTVLLVAVGANTLRVSEMPPIQAVKTFAATFVAVALTSLLMGLSEKAKPLGMYVAEAIGKGIVGKWSAFVALWKIRRWKKLNLAPLERSNLPEPHFKPYSPSERAPHPVSQSEPRKGMLSSALLCDFFRRPKRIMAVVEGTDLRVNLVISGLCRELDRLRVCCGRVFAFSVAVATLLPATTAASASDPSLSQVLMRSAEAEGCDKELTSGFERLVKTKPIVIGITEIDTLSDTDAHRTLCWIMATARAHANVRFVVAMRNSTFMRHRLRELVLAYELLPPTDLSILEVVERREQ